MQATSNKLVPPNTTYLIWLILIAMFVSTTLLEAGNSPLPYAKGVIKDNSEFIIQRESIYPAMVNEELPRDGMKVDENAPWLHFRIPILTDEEKKMPNKIKDKLTAERLTHRRYHFKLSQDPNFKSNVILSEPKMWSFWNPYQKLATGKWYWKHGLSLDSNTSNINWSNKVLSFYITGNERINDYPSVDKFMTMFDKKATPVYSIKKENIGKLLSNDPELKKELIKEIDKNYNKNMDMKIIVDESKLPKSVTQNKVKLYFMQNANKKFMLRNTYVESLLRAYLLTGDKKYKIRGIEAFWQLDKEYNTTLMRYSKRKGYPGDFPVTAHMRTMMLLLDAFSSDLTQEQINYMVEYLYKTKKDEGYLNFEQQLEYSAHTVYKAHLWQGQVRSLFNAGIVLSKYKKDARNWLAFSYELMLYRNVAGSRNDGAWHGGNGYYGVNLRHLIHVPYVMGYITNYDYFQHPWYQNLNKFSAFARPPISPRIAFGDSTGIANGQTDHSPLDEYLAYLYPDNYWNLWRLKSTDQYAEKGKFAKKVLQDESSWDILDIWLHKAKPNYHNIKAPTAQAAVFPDTGYVALHSNMANPKQDLFLNFRSCPFGAINHGHPAQNAFNLAYGEYPLFWKTGYCHGSTAHLEASYKNTRAHNTILPNYATQGETVNSFGWIPRFLRGNNIYYFAGDASNAYKLSKEGDPKVTRFRRHVVMLKPNYIVIYDELESEKSIPWVFKVNNLEKITKDSENSVVSTNGSAQAKLTMFSTNAISTLVSDKFKEDPTNDRGRLNIDKKGFKNHYHVEMTTKNNVTKNRFLSIIEVNDNSEKTKPLNKITMDKNGVIKLNGYTVTAQLDTSKKPFIEIKSNDDSELLVNGTEVKGVTFKGQTFNTKEIGSTILLTTDSGKVNMLETIDILPDALKYGNIY